MGTLTIVKTTKGMRFGGYTEKNWYNSNKNQVNSRKDDKGICFCFSLDLFKIYDLMIILNILFLAIINMVHVFMVVIYHFYQYIIIMDYYLGLLNIL